MIRDTRLGPEIIDNRRRVPRRALLRHRLEQVLQLAQVLALARGGALDEALPGLGVGKAGVDDALEDVVFGLNGHDGAVGAVLEVFRLVLLGCKKKPPNQQRSRSWRWGVLGKRCSHLLPLWSSG